MLSSGPSYQLSQLEMLLASYFHRLLAICNITSMECHMHMHFVSCGVVSRPHPQKERVSLEGKMPYGKLQCLAPETRRGSSNTQE